MTTNSGNLADLRVGGKRVIDVAYDAEALIGAWADPAVAWTAAVRGWHRELRRVGTGRTALAALADLADRLGEPVEHLRSTSHVNVIGPSGG